MQPTFRPNKRKRIVTHGFRQRMRDARDVLKRRMAKGRKKLTVSQEGKKYV